MEPEIQKWVEETSELLFLANLDLLKHTKHPSSEYNLTEAAFYMMMRKLISHMLYEALTEYKGKNLNNEQMYEYTRHKLAVFKVNMQNVISSAFEEGFSKFSHTPIDYYCQIIPISEPVNKQPC